MREEARHQRHIARNRWAEQLRGASGLLRAQETAKGAREAEAGGEREPTAVPSADQPVLEKTDERDSGHRQTVCSQQEAAALRNY